MSTKQRGRKVKTDVAVEPKVPKVDPLQAQLSHVLSVYVYARFKHIRLVENDTRPISGSMQVYDNIVLKEPMKKSIVNFKLANDTGRMLHHIAKIVLDELATYKNGSYEKKSQFYATLDENTDITNWIYNTVIADKRQINVGSDKDNVVEPKVSISMFDALIKNVVVSEVIQSGISVVMNRFIRMLAYDIGSMTYYDTRSFSGHSLIGVIRLYKDSLILIKNLVQHIKINPSVNKKSKDEKPDDDSLDLSLSISEGAEDPLFDF